MEENEGIVFFYNGLQAHMSSVVIKALFKQSIPIIALPYHNSDRLQLLAVSLFGLLKLNFTARIKNCCTKARTMEYNKKVGGFDLRKNIVDGFGDAFTSENASSWFAN